jgi:hypothetical protein
VSALETYVAPALVHVGLALALTKYYKGLGTKLPQGLTEVSTWGSWGYLFMGLCALPTLFVGIFQGMGLLGASEIQPEGWQPMDLATFLMNVGRTVAWGVVLYSVETRVAGLPSRGYASLLFSGSQIASGITIFVESESDSWIGVLMALGLLGFISWFVLLWFFSPLGGRENSLPTTRGFAWLVVGQVVVAGFFATLNPVGALIVHIVAIVLVHGLGLRLLTQFAGSASPESQYSDYVAS